VATPLLTGVGPSPTHSWFILSNLLGLLLGFALPSEHFEDSKGPAVLPKHLPAGWKSTFVLLAMVLGMD